MTERKRVLILGGGVGGTLVANLLARRLQAHEAEITLLDETGQHVYQPGFLYVAFGEMEPADLRRPERQLLSKRVSLVQDRAVGILTRERRVETAGGRALPYDYLVLGTGSHLDLDTIPGLRAATRHFYTLEGAEALRDVLETFQGGRVVIGVGGVPYKCPPAPLEFAFLLDSALRRRGLRDRTEIHYVSPLPRAFPIEAVDRFVAPIMEERGFRLHTFFNLEAVDPEAKTIRSLEGETLDYDLLVLIPPHRGAQVILDSGLAEGAGGWIPTDRHTMQVAGQEGVYAIGDATNLPVSKSGAAAHYQGDVVAGNLAAEVRGRKPEHRYDGRVVCFLEVGDNRASLLQFDYEHPPEPPRPSWFYHAGKWLFNRVYWWTVPAGRV